MAGEKYTLRLTPRGYNSNIAADLLSSVTEGSWLVKGTQNLLIGEDGTVQTRKGFTLLGEAGSRGGVSWAQTWSTNTNVDRPMRTIFDTLQVYFEDEWLDVKTGFGNNINFCGDTWWDRQQNMDRFVWANNTTNLFSWQGGIARVASRVSATSLKKTNGATPTSKSILITAGGSMEWGYPIDAQNPTAYTSLVGVSVGNFWEEGFRAGDTVDITIAAIAGTYTIAAVNEATNEIIMTTAFGSTGSSSVVGEGITGTVNAYGPLAKTWAQERFGTPELLGTVTMTIATPAVVTYTAHGLVAGDMVQFTTTGALPTGVTASTNYYVISAGLTANAFEISATLGGAAIDTSGSQSGVHTLYKSTQMNFIMLGVSYTYTGGYNTDTLTGIVPNLPATIADDTPVMSDVETHLPTGGDYSTGATPSVLAISRNQVYLGDTTRNWVWISKQDNFANYSYTVPVRTNGEGGSARLDKNIGAIIVNNQDNSVRISAGTDSFYPITLVSVTSNGTAGEEVRVGNPLRGSAIAANNQFAVCNTKQGIMYLSLDPTFDYLQNVEQLNQVTLPVSNDIEPDLQSLNLTGVKTIFWHNHVWILIPEESLLYGYDLQRKLWQPPQIFSANALSIIDGSLILHSNLRNESYTAFVGTNDSGKPIVYVMRAMYFNGGSRERLKTMDGIFVEAMASPNTDTINYKAMLGYRGAKGIYTDVFGSADGSPYVEQPALPGGFGQSPIGQAPIGTLYTDTESADFVKVRRIFPFSKNQLEFFEMQLEFSADKLDSQFKIVAYGDNMELASSRNSILIKTN